MAGAVPPPHPVEPREARPAAQRSWWTRYEWMLVLQVVVLWGTLRFGLEVGGLSAFGLTGVVVAFVLVLGGTGR